jgi:hypothetical protein
MGGDLTERFWQELIVQSANSMRNAVNHALKALHIGANIKAVAELKETYQRGYNAAVAEYTQRMFRIPFLLASSHSMLP